MVEYIGDYSTLEIKNSSGFLGTFQGLKIKDGKEFIQAQFRDKFGKQSGYSSTFPADLLGSKFKLVCPENDDLVLTSEQLEDKRREEQTALLIDYINKNQFYSLTTFHPLKMTDKIRSKLTRLLKESQENNFIFRGDGRSPDEIEEGPFQAGFFPDSTDNIVYTTANIERALEYPEDDMSIFGRRYLYFISTRTLFEDPSCVQKADLKVDQIVSKGFPLEDIRAAVEIEAVGYHGNITGIMYNPNYRKSSTTQRSKKI